MTVVPCAVGARDEWLILHRCPRNLGRNTLRPAAENDAQRERTEVRVRPLVDMLDELGVDRIDVLKIDVEGHEAEALVPFFRTAPPALWPSYAILEVASREHWRDDLVGLMRDCGYRIAFEGSRDTHFILRSPDPLRAPADRRKETI